MTMSAVVLLLVLVYIALGVFVGFVQEVRAERAGAAPRPELDPVRDERLDITPAMKGRDR